MAFTKLPLELMLEAGFYGRGSFGERKYWSDFLAAASVDDAIGKATIGEVLEIRRQAQTEGNPLPKNFKEAQDTLNEFEEEKTRILGEREKNKKDKKTGYDRTRTFNELEALEQRQAAQLDQIMQRENLSEKLIEIAEKSEDSKLKKQLSKTFKRQENLTADQLNLAKHDIKGHKRNKNIEKILRVETKAAESSWKQRSHARIGKKSTKK